MTQKIPLLNPRKDYVFKAIFTQNTDDSRGALKSFLSAVLDKKVTYVQLQPNELAADYIGDRQTSFDVLCLIDDNEPVNIELQAVGDFEIFAKRIEYHSAHLLNYYVNKGMDFENIPKTYQISIVDFVFDGKAKDCISRYTMQTDDGRKIMERQNIIVIELPKIEKLGIVPPKDLTNVQKWCKFFVDTDKPSRQKYMAEIAESEEGIMQAQCTLVNLNQSYSQWTAEEARFNAELDRRMYANYYRHEANVETAKNLLALGVCTLEQIAQATGLSLEQVQQIAEKV